MIPASRRKATAPREAAVGPRPWRTFWLASICRRESAYAPRTASHKPSKHRGSFTYRPSQAIEIQRGYQQSQSNVRSLLGWQVGLIGCV